MQPVLHAITETDPDALSITQALDCERANGTLRDTLHGVPILVKNNTARSYSVLGATAPSDSIISAKLRAAGIIILGSPTFPNGQISEVIIAPMAGVHTGAR